MTFGELSTAAAFSPTGTGGEASADRSTPPRYDASEKKITLGPGKFSTVTGTNSVAVVGVICADIFLSLFAD